MLPANLFTVLLLNSMCLQSIGGASGSDECHYGRHASVTASHCQEIIDHQPECYAESGLYWLKTDSGQAYQTYCDMYHMGGGWTRVFSHHHDENTACPLGPGGETTWKVYNTSGGSVYCQRGSPQDGHVAFVDWNTDQMTAYSEVRGYVVMLYQRNESNLRPDGFFGGSRSTPLDQDYMDGLTIQALANPVRHIYSYVLARAQDSPKMYGCPKNGGTLPPTALPPFEEGSFACFELDNDWNDLDGDNFVTQPLFQLEVYYFAESPSGSPWFQVRDTCKNYCMVIIRNKLYILLLCCI